MVSIELKNEKTELRRYYTVGTSKVLSIPAVLAHDLKLDKSGYITVSYATIDNMGIIIFSKFKGDGKTKTLESYVKNEIETTGSD